MAKSPGLAITKEREMGKCDASCPPPAAPAPHPHPPPHRQQMLRFRKFTTAPQMSTVRSGKNLRMVRMWIVDMHPAPPVVWHLHIFRGYCVYTLLVSKLVINFISALWMPPSVRKEGRGGGNEHNWGSCRPLFRTQPPTRTSLGQKCRKRGQRSPLRGGSAFGSWSLLAPTRAVFRWGRPKVEEVNIVTLVY